jgi:hypothetical protein
LNQAIRSVVNLSGDLTLQNQCYDKQKGSSGESDFECVSSVTAFELSIPFQMQIYLLSFSATYLLALGAESRYLIERRSMARDAEHHSGYRSAMDNEIGFTDQSQVLKAHINQITSLPKWFYTPF